MVPAQGPAPQFKTSHSPRVRASAFHNLRCVEGFRHARRQGTEIAGYENRLVGIETRLTGIEAKVSMLQWMVGLNLAVSLAIVVILFRSLGG